jgi:hypothetical protein
MRWIFFSLEYYGSSNIKGFYEKKITMGSLSQYWFGLCFGYLIGRSGERHRNRARISAPIVYHPNKDDRHNK